MNITTQSVIGELVAQDYRVAPVFQSYGIDFCCKGGRTIGEACEAKKLAPQQVIDSLLKRVGEDTDKATDYRSWPLDLLTEYIEKIHHSYVENKVAEIKPFLHKIVQVHGQSHPELAKIETLFNQSAGELAMHMKKEEMILFPYIRKMVKATNTRESLPEPPFGSVSNPIAMMHHEHDSEGERFREIARLSGDYNPPADACNTYRVTFAMLKEFEEDLHLHIHLENNILFPKALELEKSTRANV